MKSGFFVFEKCVFLCLTSVFERCMIIDRIFQKGMRTDEILRFRIFIILFGHLIRVRFCRALFFRNDPNRLNRSHAAPFFQRMCEKQTDDSIVIEAGERRRSPVFYFVK